MIEFTDSDLPSRTGNFPRRVVVVGVGNAGVSLLDRLAIGGVAGDPDLVAVNTDQTSLSASVAPTRILIGPKTARGLGAGGDPDLGAEAAEESAAELEEAIGNATSVIVCAGLGGGCGSGAAPEICRIAANKGILVIALVTHPFSFEGRRRAAQAQDAALAISDAASATLMFENDRMSSLSEPLAGVHETFSIADGVLADCASAILRLARAPGPVSVSQADLAAIFRGGGTNALFGAAAAAGKNRAHTAVEGALKCPLMDRGRLLSEARSILVHIDGPTAMTFAEVHAVMDAVARQAEDEARIHMSMGLSDEFGDQIVVSILADSSETIRGHDAPAKPAPQLQQVERETPEPIPDSEAQADDEELSPTSEAVEQETFEIDSADEPREEKEPDPDPAVTERPAPTELFNTAAYAVPKPGRTKPAKVRAKQETLGLDPVSKGRFDKSEPTIVGGEDLDVPAFLRQRVKLQ